MEHICVPYNNSTYCMYEYVTGTTLYLNTLVGNLFKKVFLCFTIYLIRQIEPSFSISHTFQHISYNFFCINCQHISYQLSAYLIQLSYLLHQLGWRKLKNQATVATMLCDGRGCKKILDTYVYYVHIQF